MILQLCEKPFIGFQGEGKTQGKNCLFIRFFGCPNNCVICDSKFKQSKMVDFYIGDYNIGFNGSIVFTGGEPLNYFKVIKEITNKNHFGSIEIETSGVISISKEYEEFFNYRNVLFNISPKGNIQQRNCGKPKLQSQIDLMPRLLNNNLHHKIVKFLFNSEEDFKYVHQIKEEYGLRDNQIYCQPIGTNKNQIIKLIKKHYQYILLNRWNISLRQHVILFGNRRGI